MEHSDHEVAKDNKKTSKIVQRPKEWFVDCKKSLRIKNKASKTILKFMENDDGPIIVFKNKNTLVMRVEVTKNHPEYKKLRDIPLAIKIYYLGSSN